MEGIISRFIITIDGLVLLPFDSFEVLDKGYVLISGEESTAFGLITLWVDPDGRPWVRSSIAPMRLQ